MHEPKIPPTRRPNTAVPVLLAAICVAVLGGYPTCARSAEGADDERGILRYAPLKGALVPIPKEELKVGHVYNHFSPRLNRRVWSYVQSNGEFWYALGEGTTQEAWRLDMRVTAEEAKEILARVAPRLYQQLQQQETGRVYLRLTAENQWVVAEGTSFPTIYNAETGYRWEKHFGEYLPVSSGPGQYRWTVQNSRYLPSDRLSRPAAGVRHLPLSTHCGCR